MFSPGIERKKTEEKTLGAYSQLNTVFSQVMESGTISQLAGKTEKSGIGRLIAHIQIDTKNLRHIGTKHLIFAPEWHKMEV